MKAEFEAKKLEVTGITEAKREALLKPLAALTSSLHELTAARAAVAHVKADEDADVFAVIAGADSVRKSKVTMLDATSIVSRCW